MCAVVVAKFLRCFIILLFFNATCNGAYIFGWMLHNPIPDGSTATELSESRLLASDEARGNETSELLRVRCEEDSDCVQFDGTYCDTHYGYCDHLHEEGDLCRRDGQCENGLICIFGKCEVPAKPGHKGARCNDESDCKDHLCCARQHGEKICKSKLQRGHQCYVPLGGLDYSLNELCPCDDGLVCVKRKTKHKRLVFVFAAQTLCRHKKIFASKTFLSFLLRRGRHFSSELNQLKCMPSTDDLRD